MRAVNRQPERTLPYSQQSLVWVLSQVWWKPWKGCHDNLAKLSPAKIGSAEKTNGELNVGEVIPATIYPTTKWNHPRMCGSHCRFAQVISEPASCSHNAAVHVGHHRSEPNWHKTIALRPHSVTPKNFGKLAFSLLPTDLAWPLCDTRSLNGQQFTVSSV